MTYAGDLTVHQAIEKLREGAVLVDVRTVEEWEQVGVPVTDEVGTPALFVEWNHGDGTRNPDFLDEIANLKGKEVLLLCRSGRRSIDSAVLATEAGHTAYNILGGFEADGGWQQSGQTWKKN